MARSGLLSLAVVAIVSLAAFTPAQAQSYANPLELAKATPTFSTFYAAASKDSGLVSGLNNPATAVTIFAPTNAAFSKYLAQANLTATQLLDSPDLNRILEYHVVPFALGPSDLYAGRTMPTLLGTSSTWSLAVDVEYDNTGSPLTMIMGTQSEAFIVGSGVQTDKSWVFAIDSVLSPPAANTPAVATAGK